MHRYFFISDYCYSKIDGSSISESKGKKRITTSYFPESLLYFITYLIFCQPVKRALSSIQNTFLNIFYNSISEK